MPEISEQRLVELEMLETVVKEIVLPMVIREGAEMKIERPWKSPNRLTDKQAQDQMEGHAVWDDPPEGWTKKDLAQWSRGYLYGREIVARNIHQYFHLIAKALEDPIAYWKRWSLGYLDMLKWNPCTDGCDGHYDVDEERIGMVCDKCGRFYSYQEIVKIRENAGKEE